MQRTTAFPGFALSRRDMAGRRSQRRSNAVSCWYCDFKIYSFNEGLFSLGQRYSRFLKTWFTLGVVFSFVTLAGVSLMLLWNMLDAFNLQQGTSGVNDILGLWLFGTSSLHPGLSISIMDAGFMIISTLLSVGLHEFGHAIAAASEGLQIEYIAVFLAILFPGALVAFNFDWLQSLPRAAALRIYSAGIWHNAIFCVVCVLTLISVPMLMHPFYLHGAGPLVLEVSKASPLYGYLSPYDVITAVDGSNIKYPHEWINLMTEIDSQMLPQTSEVEKPQQFKVHHRKGYCVPRSWIEGSSESNSCHTELAAFVPMPCFSSRTIFESLSIERNKSEDKHCLIAKEVIKLKKCWNDLSENRTNDVCSCSEDETCMAPLQIPNMSWVEVTYYSPYTSDCLEFRRNSSVYNHNHDLGSISCGGSFMYIGDALSLAHSVHLSAYQPRWASAVVIAHIPNMLERILSCCFHVSASLAVVNSLPVYFLDGESILETILSYFTFLNRRHRQGFLQFCLTGGTILSIISFSRILYFIVAVRL